MLVKSLFLVVCLVLTIHVCYSKVTPAESNVLYGVTYNNGDYGLANAMLRPDDHFLALGSLNDTVNDIGFTSMTINTSSLFSDQQQAYAAGYLESYLTVNQTVQLLKNVAAWEFYEISKAIKPFMNYFTEWQEYIDTMINNHASSDEYWYHVSLIMNQTDGMLAGYNSNVAKQYQIDRTLLILINAWVEVGDVISAVEFNATTGGTADSGLESIEFNNKLQMLKNHQFLTLFQTDKKPTHTRCSGLIKMTSDDIFLSHCTWSGYVALFRIMKYFKFSFAPGFPVPGNTISFSSYPLTIYSADDFYVTNAGLAVFETTNDVFNQSLFQQVKATGSVMAWVRTMVANRMTKTAGDWTSTFAKYNSGTVNNQWVVLDYKLVQEGTNGISLMSGAISVLEQLPGLVHTEDQTDLVNKQSYWSSFNVPYYENIWSLSGYGTMLNSSGGDPEYTWNNCARHNIFERDQANVTSLSTMQNLMRSNDYVNDPLSSGNPTHVISSRYDLLTDDQGGAGAFGATDCKIVSYKTYKSLGYEVVMGPTHKPQSEQPVFQFSTAPKAVRMIPHAGLPDAWDFTWQSMRFD